jgi:hypothetical protein
MISLRVVLYLPASPFRVVPLPVAFFLSISLSRCFSGTLFFFFFFFVVVVARRKREITREREREDSISNLSPGKIYLMIIIIRARVG